MIHGSILEAVGGTPLVWMPRFSADIPPVLIGKVEYLNPGGSIKDRIGLAMVEAAEREGRLRPGGTIVEPTSGNTGAGLAIVAALRGYRMIAVMADKQSKEKQDLLRAYGAEVVVCPTAVPPEHPDSYYRTAERLVAEIEGAFRPDQYSNPANPEAHYGMTGPELWEQLDGRIDVLIAGLGTGGTITGLGRYLKEHNPDVLVVGADPEGSIFSGDVHTYLVEGVGEDFWPTTFDPSVVDRYVRVSDRDAFLTTRRLAREEGLLVGGSAGMAAHAALVVGSDLPAGARAVVVLPDGGRNYLSKIFDDDWMAGHGFLGRSPTSRTVGDVLRSKSRELPEVVTVAADATVRRAIDLLHDFGVSQLPVVKHEEVVGTMSEDRLLEQLYRDPDVLDRPVHEAMTEPLPEVARSATVAHALEAMVGGLGALLVRSGR